MKQPYRSPEQRRKLHANRQRRRYHSVPGLRERILARHARRYRSRHGVDGYTAREQDRAAQVTFVFPLQEPCQTTPSTLKPSWA